MMTLLLGWIVQGQRGLGAGGLGRGSGSLTMLCGRPASPVGGGAEAGPPEPAPPTLGAEGPVGPPPPPAEELGPPGPAPPPATEWPPGGGGAESCGVVEWACCTGRAPG